MINMTHQNLSKLDNGPTASELCTTELHTVVAQLHAGHSTTRGQTWLAPQKAGTMTDGEDPLQEQWLCNMRVKANLSGTFLNP